jgi:hypothetical protein
MRSLPSSGWSEIERCKRSLVIQLVKKSGDFWQAIDDIRRRWSIEAECRIPPAAPTLPPDSMHFPRNAPVRVNNPYKEGWEEWSFFLDEWKQELESLCDKAIPASARFSDSYLSRQWWGGFLSACVVYDPPDAELEGYADNHPQIFIGTYDPEDRFRDDFPKLFMSRPPIVYTRRAEDIERAYSRYAEEVAIRVAERLLQDEPGDDAIKTVLEVLGERDLDGPLEAERIENPTRAFIEVRPWHTEQDIISAFRMISATQDRENHGNRSRDPLRALQCAILHDRCGWTYEEIAGEYGWSVGSNKVGKYIKDGRTILDE